MLDIHTILHPTDFSPHSEYALVLACALARDYGARLVVLHVVEQRPLVYEGVVLPPAGEELLAAAQEELEQMQVPLEISPVERRIVEGDPVTEILAAAESMTADLIVMGTHGRTGLRRLIMGSVAEQVARRASCPVLTIRTPFAVTEAKPAPAHAEPYAGAGI
jgi:nucleotide-binding universal stress UspA family protein